jgi:hypothetical protein
VNVTIRIHYELNTDAQYLVMWSEDYEHTRYFVAGPDGVRVERGKGTPPEVRHAVTTIMLVELMDELLKFGIRPSSNAWSAGHVSDLKAHIAFAERMATSLLPKGNGDA